jgi:hypothetical protein
MNDDLLQRILDLEGRLNQLEKSDRYFYQKDIQMNDGRNVLLGLTSGTKIGTSASQKIGFWGTTPVVQQNFQGANNVTVPGGATLNVTSAAKGYTNSGSAYTISDIVGALKAVGILAQ